MKAYYNIFNPEEADSKGLDLILYHQKKQNLDCQDGIASAYVLYKHFERYNKANLIEIKGGLYQGDKVPDVSKYDVIYLVDLTYPNEVIEDWTKNGKTVQVFDHHKTAIEHLAGIQVSLNKFIHDVEECGATLIWKYHFKDKPLPAWLEYIRDRDLWINELPEHEMVRGAFEAYLSTFAPFGDARIAVTFKWFDYLSTLDRDQLLEYLRPVGSAFLDKKTMMIRTAASRAIQENFMGESDYPAVTVRLSQFEDQYASDICHLMLQNHPDILFAAALQSNGIWQLRSDKDGANFDVSKVASKYLGGGHHNSAGFRAISKSKSIPEPTSRTEAEKRKSLKQKLRKERRKQRGSKS